MGLTALSFVSKFSKSPERSEGSIKNLEIKRKAINLKLPEKKVMLFLVNYILSIINKEKVFGDRREKYILHPLQRFKDLFTFFSSFIINVYPRIGASFSVNICRTIC